MFQEELRGQTWPGLNRKLPWMSWRGWNGPSMIIRGDVTLRTLQKQTFFFLNFLLSPVKRPDLVQTRQITFPDAVEARTGTSLQVQNKGKTRRWDSKFDTYGDKMALIWT